MEVDNDDAATSAVQAPAKHILPELEIYCYLLVILFLIDQKRYDEVESITLLCFVFFFFHFSLLCIVVPVL